MSEKIKARAAIWIDGRQRQKVKYFISDDDAADWKAETESLMQRMKLQKTILRQLGADHPQVEAGHDALKTEGFRSWRIIDFFAALEIAKSNIISLLGNEYLLLIDGSDLTDFFEMRVSQGISLGELEIEASLLKIFFQWGLSPKIHTANKVKAAYEQVVRCNMHQLQSEAEPYLHHTSKTSSAGHCDTSEGSILDKIQVLLQEGHSQREIATLLKVNQSTVSRKLKNKERRCDA